MSLDDKKREQFLEKRERMRERHKRVQELDDNSEVEYDENGEETISLESLQEQLQTLKHEINIETIQNKLRVHEQFFKELGDDKELLFDILRLYKQKRELKQKNK
jgi:conjugal transfer/entry exclusion protein